MGEVLNMTLEKELLQSIHKASDMGCEGIKQVIHHTKDKELKSALKAQYLEFQKFRQEAASMLNAQGVKPKGIGTMAKVSSSMMSKGKLLKDHSSSKIAEMTIQGNNMGISQTIKQLHQYHGTNEAATALAQRVLKAEGENVSNMQRFL